MPSTDRLFSGAIPRIYDTYLVPQLFEPYADDLARRVAQAGPASVLETAAGTGVVARALAPLLAADCSYVVTDLNQPMLDLARDRQPADGRVGWRLADAMQLPFDDESFDVVCCQFGVMFLPDRVAGYREALRTLRPGGRFIFNVWDRIEENVFTEVVTAAAAELFPDDPPAFLARVPHGYHEVDRIRADLLAAGFASVEIETLARESVAAKPEHPAIALCQGTPLRNEIEAREGISLEEVTRHATRAIASRFGPGPVVGKIQAHVVTAVK
jgi:ubiquinone/menaquinone biosynthesis C-methylase UbiE